MQHIERPRIIQSFPKGQGTTVLIPCRLISSGQRPLEGEEVFVPLSTLLAEMESHFVKKSLTREPERGKA